MKPVADAARAEDHARSTTDLIVELAHETMQVGGYAGLNYGDIAAALGITRAAIHHHFPGKVDLARQVISRYREWTEQQLALIDRQGGSAAEKLRAYVGLYRSIVEQGDERLCPGGMLAAEVMSLPVELREEVKKFFDCHVTWVAMSLVHGDDPFPDASALRLVASLQGSLLVARLYGSADYFDAMVAGLLPEDEPR